MSIFRLKKVQGKKKRDTAARDAEKQAQVEIQAEADKQDKATFAVEEVDPSFEGSAATDLLSGKDEDIIF